MEKNKKRKIVINSALAGILATSGIIASSVALTSCNVSISAGNGSSNNSRPQMPTKNPGFSNFIEDINKNDVKILETSAKKPLPKPSTYKPMWSSEKILFSKEYILGTKQVQQILESSKQKIEGLIQKLVIDKINSVFNDGITEFNTFANIKKTAKTYSISYQLSKKSIEDLNATIKENNDEQKPEDDKKPESNKLQPFFAFQYNFDFNDFKLDINDNGYLVISGVKTNNEFDINGRLEDFPSELNVDINNDIKLFNKKFANVELKANPYEEIQNWTKSKLSNKSFLESILSRVHKSAETKFERIKFMGGWVYDLLVAIKANGTLRETLVKMETPNKNLVKKMGYHQTVINLVNDFYKKDFRYGDTDTQGTFRYDINEMGKAGVINPLIAKGINAFLTTFPDTRHPIDDLFELPNKLEQLGQKGVEELITKVLTNIVGKDLAATFAPEVFKALKKLEPKIKPIFNLLMEIIRMCPNGKLADMKVLEFITSSQFKNFFWNKVQAKVDAMTNQDSKTKAQKVIDFAKSKLTFSKDLLDGLLYDITNLGYKTEKKFFPSKWRKVLWDERITLKQYFTDYTTFSMVDEKISVNPDGQTFNIKAVYRMTFNQDVYLQTERWKTFFGNTKIKEFFDALSISFKGIEFTKGLKLYKKLPDYFSFKQGNYIEFRIEDPRGFIIPTSTGYDIKVNQQYKVDFTNAVNSFFYDFKMNVPEDIFGIKVEDLVDKNVYPYKEPFNNYYFKKFMPDNLLIPVEDNNNKMNLKNMVYDGYTVDNSKTKLDEIKNNIIAPYLRANKFNLNQKENFVFDLPNDIKDKVLTSLGLNPKIYIDKSKFILKMKPGFSMKPLNNGGPSMNASLDISFNVPVTKAGSLTNVLMTNKWINNIQINNIKF